VKFATLLAATGGARWDRFFGIVLVLGVVLVLRTVLVRFLGHPHQATRPVRDDDATEIEE
jgi:hypothetical protein